MNFKSWRCIPLLAAATVVVGTISGNVSGQAPKSVETKSGTVPLPQPTVPEITTLEGTFVRAAYNNEGYVILGYQMAQRSLKEPWLMLEVGIALRDKVKDYTLKREAISLEIPSGAKVALPNREEYRKGEADVQALQNRAKVQRDSINYFPPNAYRACRLGFFADLDQRVVAWDLVELTDDRACLGRLYFQVPGGITYGQYWLDVQFAQSLVRVPFRIFTEEEEKLVSKNFSSIKKQVDNAFKKKKS